MNDQKIDNLLNLALDATAGERARSMNLNTGYNPEEGTWELIVKYSGDILALENDMVQIVPLLNNYAIVTVRQTDMQKLFEAPQIEFVEKPKRLFFAVNEGRRVSCINPVTPPSGQLTGAGVLIGLVDSGVDIYHRDFRNADGTTRIEALWDQTLTSESVMPPAGYYIGSYYTKTMIDNILARPVPPSAVPGADLSGHGTAVLGIAAGNGSQSGGQYAGVAPESGIIAVKLGTPRPNSFPRTTELIQAVNFVLETAAALGLPVVINISFGNVYGAHNGASLLEHYLNDMAGVWKNCIVIGTGNEGSAGGHISGRLARGQISEIPFTIADYEPAMNIQLWKNFFDGADIEIVAPGGQTAGPIQNFLGTQRFVIENTELLLYYGEASPYTMAQEIYIDFLPSETYVSPGIWKIRLRPNKIIDGEFHLWMPGSTARSPQTRFLYPEPDGTMTIPSTAFKPIAAAAYDGYTDAYADFSGRGSVIFNQWIKPDLAAPGVDIVTVSAAGGYRQVSGTSFAAPFVSGSCALMMEYGIIMGNDPYLYGEKVKAYLISGVRKLPGIEFYPNNKVGYGALCLRDSF